MVPVLGSLKGGSANCREQHLPSGCHAWACVVGVRWLLRKGRLCLCGACTMSKHERRVLGHASETSELKRRFRSLMCDRMRPPRECEAEEESSMLRDQQLVSDARC